jgi:serine/threonine-protein kinase
VIGTTIGNYEVQRLIGEGGVGKVYVAVHPGIGQQAAVKVLPSARRSPSPPSTPKNGDCR